MANPSRLPVLTRIEGAGVDASNDLAAVDDQVLSAIAGLRFGSVEVVVHDGRVVQIVRTEKLRFDR